MTAGTAPVRRILHLSDLHFGRDDPALEAPLVAAIDDARSAANALSRRLNDAQRPLLQPLLTAFLLTSPTCVRYDFGRRSTVDQCSLVTRCLPGVCRCVKLPLPYFVPRCGRV